MSTQKSQSYKRQEQNNTEWLDELINKIENMKNKISNTFNYLFLLSFIPLLKILNTFVIKPAGFFNKVIYFIFAKSYLTMFK